MKRNIFIFGILFLAVGTTFAQNPPVDYGCVGEIRTTSSTINTWNWQTEQFEDVYVKDRNGQLIHLDNPHPWSPFLFL